MERLVDKEGQLEVDSLSHWKPVELPQHWSDIVTSTSAGDESRSRVLHRLEAPEQTVCDATEQRITVYSQVQPTPVVHWDKHALRLNVHQLCE